MEQRATTRRDEQRAQRPDERAWLASNSASRVCGTAAISSSALYTEKREHALQTAASSASSWPPPPLPAPPPSRSSASSASGSFNSASRIAGIGDAGDAENGVTRVAGSGDAVVARGSPPPPTRWPRRTAASSTAAGSSPGAPSLASDDCSQKVVQNHSASQRAGRRQRSGSSGARRARCHSLQIERRSCARVSMCTHHVRREREVAVRVMDISTPLGSNPTRAMEVARRNVVSGMPAGRREVGRRALAAAPEEWDKLTEQEVVG